MRLKEYRFGSDRGSVVYCRDCMEGMKELVEPGSVDVVVTSPPYNLGIDYNTYNDRISRKEYLEWTREWAMAVRDSLSPDGSFFLNIGSVPRDPWVPFEVAAVMRDIFVLQNTIHWVKSIYIPREDIGDYPGIETDVNAGHYKPVNSNRFLNDCHEYIFHFTKTGKVPIDRLAIGVPYKDKSNVSRWKRNREDREDERIGAGKGEVGKSEVGKGEREDVAKEDMAKRNTVKGRDLRCRGNLWFIPYKTISDKSKERPHPATFPEKLPRMCILLHGVERCNLVMDPFMGLGSSALASIDLNKGFVGFEMDDEYFAEAVRRIEQRERVRAQVQG